VLSFRFSTRRGHPPSHNPTGDTPPSTDRALRTAWRCLRDGSLERAIAIHQRLIEHDPAPQLRNRTGDLLARARRPEPAIRLFLEVADEYQRGGFGNKARAIYRKILRLDPLHPAAHCGLATIEQEGSPAAAPRARSEP
jgi:tetratricopeptide (TPR) repeat protein